MNKRMAEHRSRTAKSRNKILNITKRINKGSFKDIPIRDIATYSRTLGFIDGIMDNNLLVPGESITISNMDSNDTIVTFSVVLNGTSDTFTNNNWNVELLSTGP